MTPALTGSDAALLLAVDHATPSGAPARALLVLPMPPTTRRALLEVEMANRIANDTRPLGEPPTLTPLRDAGLRVAPDTSGLSRLAALPWDVASLVAGCTADDGRDARVHAAVTQLRDETTSCGPVVVRTPDVGRLAEALGATDPATDPAAPRAQVTLDHGTLWARVAADAHAPWTAVGRLADLLPATAAPRATRAPAATAARRSLHAAPTR